MSPDDALSTFCGLELSRLERLMAIQLQPLALRRAATPESNPWVLFGPKFIFVHSQRGGMGPFRISAVGYKELGGGCASFSPI